MILPLLVALILVLGSLGAAIDAGISSLRQGRAQFRRAVAAALAERGLAEAEMGGWTAAGSGLVVGGGMSLPPVVERSGLRADRDVRRLSTELWLVRSRGEVRDAGGGLLAGVELGLVVLLVQKPADSTFQVRPIRRPWIARGT